MQIQNGLFTSESVSAGHPDKLCDRISDAILDGYLAHDPDARVACETLALDGRIIVAGEFKATDAARQHMNEQAENIVRQAIRDVGYGSADLDIDPDSCRVELAFNSQSSEIGDAVDGSTTLGAGDQGMMFGYACNETPELMPLAWSLATRLIDQAQTANRLAPNSETQTLTWGLRTDGKAQVTVRYEGGRPIGVQSVVMSWQHDKSLSVERVRHWLELEVVDVIIPQAERTEDFVLHLNPAGPFTVGGPKADTGLTGRKIIVDTYGGYAPHGGGAFSGKDPSKVDRSGAYAARWIAKNIVAAGLADRAAVQLSYAIGLCEPTSITVDTAGTGEVPDSQFEGMVKGTFDLTPQGIIEALNLKRPIYTATSSLGHFGAFVDPDLCLWERTDMMSDVLRRTLYQRARPPRTTGQFFGPTRAAANQRGNHRGTTVSIAIAIDFGSRGQWCVSLGCTTCGAWQMRQVILGQLVTRRPAHASLDSLTVERATEVIKELSELNLDFGDARAVRFILTVIWWKFGDRAHEELFPVLDGSDAGRIYDDARDHFAGRQRAQREHQARQGVRTTTLRGGSAQ